MNFTRILLLLCLLPGLRPSMGIAQSAVPVGPVAVGGGAVGGGVPGAGSGLNMSGVYVPGTAPGMTATAGPQLTGYGGSGYGYGASPLSAFAAMCVNAIGSLLTGTTAQTDATTAAGRELEKATFDGLDGKYDYAPGANHNAWKNLASGFNKSLNGKCEQKFISKDGKLGQWGLYMYGQMKNHEDVYMNEKWAPKDMGQYCRKFDSFSADARARFYTYLFMVMADPESSCNETAVGKGPNGAAIGLYQLETPACDRVGVRGTSRDLLNAQHNMKCAVALLAKELKARETITVGTSRGFTGTYWAPLRNDIAARKVSSNSMARADTKASEKTQYLLKKFTECETGEDQSNNPNANTAFYTPVNPELSEFFSVL